MARSLSLTRSLAHSLARSLARSFTHSHTIGRVNSRITSRTHIRTGRGLAWSVVLVDRDRAFRGDEPLSLSSSAAVYGSIEHARSIAHDPHRVYFRPLSCYRNSTGNVDETSQARGTSYPRANALLNTALSLISLSLSLSQLPPSREDNFFSYLLLFPSPLSVSSTFSLSLSPSLDLSYSFLCLSLFFSLFLSFPRSPRFSPFSPVSRVRRLFPSLPVEDGAPRNVIR